VPDRLKAAARAASFAQLAVDAHAGSDEERHGGGEAREQNNDTEALARAFAELVGDEKARAHTHSHLGGCGHGGCGKVPGESVEEICHVLGPYPIPRILATATGDFLLPGIAPGPAKSSHRAMAQDLYALILAGGSGERFWPYSRRARPKQLLKLFSERTMLEETIARLGDAVPPDRVFVLTNREQEAAVRASCPGLPPENIVAEPAKRDTAPAVALGVGLVLRRDPQAVMAVLPADHLIKDTATFRRDLLAGAEAAAKRGALLTIGIKPTWACPGFGYIEQGPRAVDADPAIFEVKRFREKPDAALAESFLKQGNFRWNAGMFIWSIPSIMGELTKHAPELAAFVARMRTAKDLPALLESDFPKLPKISVDYAIMEKAAHVLELEAGFDWDDVGSWVAVSKYLAQHEGGNAANCALTSHDASHNIVFSGGKKHVALAGVQDLIVIDTGDALLVCHRSEAENIKKLVPRVPEDLQ
jgi:mannose-1-phosphate guanylyltransferase